MAKAKGRPKKPSGEGTQVRIAPELATQARYIAAHEGTTVLDLLSAILRPVLSKRFLKIKPEGKPDKEVG